MKVELNAFSGSFVARGAIPPFTKYPDVLFWGGRVFHHIETSLDAIGERVGVYEEAFSFHLIHNLTFTKE